MMRTSPKRFIKVVFIVSTVFFVLIQINFLLRNTEDDTIDSPALEHSNLSLGAHGRFAFHDIDAASFNREDLLNRLNEGRYNITRNNSNINMVEKNVDPVSNWSLPRNLNISEIKRFSWDINKRQPIRNLDKFDLSASASTIVIVVQVHNRTEYLRHLVNSLRKAAEIEHTLLIFSHDYYSDELNDIVASIDFCLVAQIFYPYSLQIHPTEFPGEDPKDCPRNVNKEQAMAMGCQNKEFPDKYGHYREAIYSQTKQHWFWKINHAFDYMDVTKNYDGPILFIEEDHYVVKDFISVLRMMFRLQSRACVDCNIITLGTYDKKPKYGIFSPKVDIMNWISSKHNMGMAMTRATWKLIKACGEPFCRFDDYNWDWSMHYIGMTCIPNKLRVMVMKSPRIYHIGECGLHAKGKNCNPSDRVEHIESLLEDNKESLFPPNLMVGGYPNAPRRVPKANGGWGDIRDHELCISFMSKDSHS